MKMRETSRAKDKKPWANNKPIGKSMILAMSIEKASQAGYRVAVISPEMQTSTISYRIDSSRTHMSNMAMQKGLLLPDYEKYFDTIDKTNEHIYIADSNDFGGDISVMQCRNFVKQTKADILFIDGIVYVKPDGWTSKMSMTDTMGETGKQLLTFSNETKIPVVSVVQAQRNKKKDTDEEDISDSTNIFGSYQLTQASTRIVSINRVGSALGLYIAKNRYGKDSNGDKKKYLYNMDFDRMLVTYIPDIDDIKKDKEAQEDMEKAKDNFKHIF